MIKTLLLEFSNSFYHRKINIHIFIPDGFHELLVDTILHIIDIFNLQVREQHLAIPNANDIWLYGNSEDWLRLYDNGHYP